jgi:RNA polymerase sigma factor (sigma-70 family)
MLDEQASMGSADEERYIDAARGGDLAAFNWLVLRYQTRVYNLCLRMLSDPDAAADATQEAFLSAYKAMPRFKGGLFRAWLLRIASNACLDVLRSRKRHPTYSLDHGPPGDEESEGEPLQIPDLDAAVDPERSAMTAEMVATIQAGLAMLPEEQRIALILVDVQGLSYEEAALVSEVNLGTV